MRHAKLQKLKEAIDITGFISIMSGHGILMSLLTFPSKLRICVFIAHVQEKEIRGNFGSDFFML